MFVSLYCNYAIVLVPTTFTTFLITAALPALGPNLPLNAFPAALPPNPSITGYVIRLKMPSTYSYPSALIA